jgi:hypothetical protein
MDHAIKAKVRQIISQWTDVGRQRASTVILHVKCMYTSTCAHTSVYIYKDLYATSTRDVYISVCMYVCVCVCARARTCVVARKDLLRVSFSLPPRVPAPWVSAVGKHLNGSRRPTDHRYRGLLAKYFQPTG